MCRGPSDEPRYLHLRDTDDLGYVGLCHVLEEAEEEDLLLLRLEIRDQWLQQNSRCQRDRTARRRCPTPGSRLVSSSSENGASTDLAL